MKITSLPNFYRASSLGLILVGLLACTAYAVPSQVGYHWVDKPGEYRELRDGDKPVLRYMYQAYDETSPETREKTYKPYHHVSTRRFDSHAQGTRRAGHVQRD